jgi:hypothetical protein
MAAFLNARNPREPCDLKRSWEPANPYNEVPDPNYDSLCNKPTRLVFKQEMYF